MKINLSCPINQTSYGYTSLGFLKSLTKLGHEISLFPIGGMEADISEHNLIKQCMINAQSFDWFVPSLRLYHQFDLAQHVGRGEKIGFTIFELDHLKNNEIHQILSLDKIIVPSKWAANVVETSVKQGSSCPTIKVVPLGYDPEIFYPRRNQRYSRTTVFQNWGKWEIRKGHDALVEIFNKAFTKDDDVQLRMYCYNQFLTQDETNSWESLYKSSELGNKVEFHAWFPTQREVAMEMALADCGIFPSRAEGWGLESMEMMAMGKEIIITNNSAHTEYCNNDNSYIIECPDKELAFDGKWFHGEGRWSVLCKDHIDQAVVYMREVHRKKQEGQLPNPINKVPDFTWDNAAIKLAEAIQ